MASTDPYLKQQAASEAYSAQQMQQAQAAYNNRNNPLYNPNSIQPATSSTTGSTTPVSSVSTPASSGYTQLNNTGIVKKGVALDTNLPGVGSTATPTNTDNINKNTVTPKSETVPITSDSLVTGGDVTTEQKLQYEQQGLQNDQLNKDLLGASKTVEQVQAEKDYQNKQEQNRLQREGLQVQNAEIASSQRIQQAGKQLDNLRQNIAYIGNMGRPAKSMVQLDAMKNQVSTAEQTFKELVQVEDNLKTIQKLGVEYNAQAFEKQMSDLQDKLDTQVGTVLQGVITDFNKEAQGIDTMDELNALREKWLDTADTSLEAITNRNFIDRQNRIEQFQQIIADKKTSIKNSNTINKEMSVVQGYYVNGNGEAIISASTGKPIPTPVEAPMDPVFDMKSGKLISFATGPDGQIVTTVDQVIDQPQFSAQVIQSMITAVQRGTMTTAQALEVLPPDAQQQFLGQVGSIQQQPKETTPLWKQDANGNWYNENSTVNPGVQVSQGQSGGQADLYKQLRSGVDANGKKFFGVYATGDPTGQRFVDGYYKPAESVGLDNYMSQWNSKGSKITTDMVQQAAQMYGVDPIAVAATMAFDSSMGTKGKGARNNNPGNIGQFDSLDAKGITVSGYATLQDGVNAVAENLKKRLDASGLQPVQSQQQISSFDPNKTAQYTSYVESGKMPVGMKSGTPQANKFLIEANQGYIAAKEKVANQAGFTISNPDAFIGVDDKVRDTINKGLTSLPAFRSTMEQLIALVEKNGTELLPGATKTKMQQLATNAKLQAKEIYNLGVLNGPDLELMNTIIPDPTSGTAKLNQLFGMGVSYKDALKNAKDTVLGVGSSNASQVGLSPMGSENNSTDTIKLTPGRIKK